LTGAPDHGLASPACPGSAVRRWRRDQTWRRARRATR